MRPNNIQKLSHHDLIIYHLYRCIRYMSNKYHYYTGLRLYICTSPVKHSVYCAQEKIEWVKKHLGQEWVDALILCQDKVSMAIVYYIASEVFYILVFYIPQ